MKFLSYIFIKVLLELFAVLTWTLIFAVLGNLFYITALSNYAGFWPLLFWVIPFSYFGWHICKVLNFKKTDFPLFVFLAGFKILIIGLAIGALVLEISPKFFHSTLILPKNYVGVVTAEPYLYKNDGQRYEADGTVEEKDEFRTFFFWQSGYIDGFDIQNIQSDMKDNAFELFLVSGLLYLIELALRLVLFLFLPYIPVMIIIALFRKKLPYTKFSEVSLSTS